MFRTKEMATARTSALYHSRTARHESQVRRRFGGGGWRDRSGEDKPVRKLLAIEPVAAAGPRMRT